MYNILHSWTFNDVEAFSWICCFVSSHKLEREILAFLWGSQMGFYPQPQNAALLTGTEGFFNLMQNVKVDKKQLQTRNRPLTDVGWARPRDWHLGRRDTDLKSDQHPPYPGRRQAKDTCAAELLLRFLLPGLEPATFPPTPKSKSLLSWGFHVKLQVF